MSNEDVIVWVCASLARSGKKVEPARVVSRPMHEGQVPSKFFVDCPVETESGVENMTLCDLQVFDLLEAEANHRGYRLAVPRGTLSLSSSSRPSIRAELFLDLPERLAA